MANPQCNSTLARLLPLARRLPAPLRSPRVAVWTVVVVGIALACLRSPLLGTLGYELALVMAAVGSLCGVDLGAAAIRRSRAASSSAACPRAIGLAVLAPVTIMALPLIMAAARTLWAGSCDPWFGVQAYLALTVASTTVAAAGSAVIAIVVGPRRWLGVAAPYLVLVFVIVAGVHRFWTEPPVFTYSPLVGYFPGNLYDEDIRLGAPLAWARLEQLAVVLACAAAATARYDRERLAVRWRGPGLAIPAAVVAVVLGGGALALRLNAGALGYAIDGDDIAAELGGTKVTPHFVIHYDATPAITADIELIAADHELRLAQVCSTIGVEPSAVGTIHSYYFATSERKGRLMGAHQVEMAKPWLRQIYLTHDEFPHSSLRHEIAHVVAGTFGDRWLGVAARRVVGLPVLVNPGLIEGLAVAIDWPGASRSMTPHQAMRAMELLGFAPAADDVFSVKFMTLASARSYTAAGSFVRFLLERYGAAGVRAVYRSGGDFAAAFGKPRATLVAEWRAMLATVEVPAAALEVARERFRRGGVFDRPCPHAIARRQAAAEARAVAGDRQGAITILRGVCRDAPDEPGYGLTLAALLAGGDPAQQAESREVYARWSRPDQGALIRGAALEALARLDGRAGAMTEARAAIDTALALPLDDDRRRSLEAMQRALDQPGLGGELLRRYFFTTDDDGLAAVLLARQLTASDGFVTYLLGLQYQERGQAAAAATALDASLTQGLPSPRFVRAASRRLAVAAWRAGDAAALEHAIAALAGTGVEVDRWLAEDWGARRAFAATTTR